MPFFGFSLIGLFYNLILVFKGYMVPLFKIREAIVKAGYRLFLQGMLPGGDGNISVRVEESVFAITPSLVSKGFLAPSDILLISASGKVLDGTGKPTTELPLHLTVYEGRPDINAVVHTHPPYVTAFSVAGKKLPPCVLPEIVVRVGSIVDVGYATPSTDESAFAIKPYLEESDVFILKNHGLVAIGTSLEEAVNLTESVEHLARVIFIANSLGEPEPIPQSKLEILMDMRRKFGKKRISIYSCEGCVLDKGGCER